MVPVHVRGMSSAIALHHAFHRAVKPDGTSKAEKAGHEPHQPLLLFVARLERGVEGANVRSRCLECIAVVEAEHAHLFIKILSQTSFARRGERSLRGKSLFDFLENAMVLT